MLLYEVSLVDECTTSKSLELKLAFFALFGGFFPGEELNMYLTPPGEDVKY